MAIPASSNAPAEAPVAILVSDQQISLQRGKSTSYAHTAIKVQTSQGLAAGNLSIGWDPATTSRSTSCTSAEEIR